MKPLQAPHKFITRWIWFCLLLSLSLCVGIMFFTHLTASAKDERRNDSGAKIRDNFNDLLQQHYPQFIKKDSDPATSTALTNLYTCKACHISADPNREGSAFNTFGTEIEKLYAPPVNPTPQQEIDALNQALDTIVKDTYSGNLNGGIDEEDPDGDFFTNFEEIVAGTFPGDSQSLPSTGLTVTMSISDQTIDEDEIVTLTFTVTNTGVITLANISINVLSGCTAKIKLLAHDSSQVTTCTFAAKESLNNVAATASGEAAKKKNISSPPSNTISLKVNPANPAQNKGQIDIVVMPERVQVGIGQNISLSVTISNSGTAPLNAITMTAPRMPDCNRVFPDPLLKNKPLHYDCSVTITEDLIDARNGEYFVSSQMHVSATNTLDLGDIVSKSFTLTLDATSRVMLPIIIAPQSTSLKNINLIVKSIYMSDQDVNVVIQNIGESELAGIGYWVDLYISPTVTPTRPNQLSEDWGDFGLVWGVTEEAKPLSPNGELTLHIHDHYFAKSHSSFPAKILEGTLIYAQVDSANSQTDYGNVLETHERDGGDYDNIYVIKLTSEVSTLAWNTEASSSSTTDRLLEKQAPRD